MRVSKSTLFLCAGRKSHVFRVSMDIHLPFVMVVIIALISVVDRTRPGFSVGI